MSTESMMTVSALPRTGLGKEEARRLRRTNQIPAVAYGKSFVSTPLAVAPKEVVTILKSAHGKNSVIKLDMGGGKNILAMIKDFSQHPVQRTLEHVDFVEVKLDKTVDVEVPLSFTGKPAGVTAGGIIRQVFRNLPVRCLPDRIPLKLEIDITHLKLNEHVSTQDIKVAEGVAIRLPAEQTLIAVVAPEKDRTEEAAPGAPGAAPAAAAGAKAGAPAAGAAPAKDAKAAAPAKDAKKK